MRRLPVLSTLVVALAVVAMVGLGVWQLQRRAQKEALLASFARNAALPEIPLPPAPVSESMLFRHVHATCSQPEAPTRSAGRSAQGVSGYRFISHCREGAFAVEMGVAPDPRLSPVWRGGSVAGVMTTAPDSTPFIARLIGEAPAPVPMIVPDHPLAPGLSASRPPDPATVPNNHLAYAVQWFAFAVIAVVIYIVALRRRRAW